MGGLSFLGVDPKSLSRLLLCQQTGFTRLYRIHGMALALGSERSNALALITPKRNATAVLITAVLLMAFLLMVESLAQLIQRLLMLVLKVLRK